MSKVQEVEQPDQIALPYKEFQSEQIAGKMVARQELNRAEDTYWVPFRELEERSGYNPRFIYKKIDELAESIAINGLNPITIDLVKEKTRYRRFIDRGHRRFRALKILADKGVLNKLDVPGIREGKVLCFVNPKDITEWDRLRNTVADNDASPFEPVELADAIWRAKHLFQKSTDEIRQAFRISRQHIDNMLILAEQSPFVKDCISKGIVKATTVTKLARHVGTAEKVTDVVAGMTKDNKKFRGSDVDEMARKEKQEQEAADPEEKFDENRTEIALCQNVIRNVDKIMTLVKKVQNPQLVGDIERLVNFTQKDMVEIRAYVKKHKK
jgi:ParB-like chromosome segregation protein Spo0J